MNKFFYYAGIYFVCAFVHDAVNEAARGIDRELHRRREKAERNKNRSLNISTGKVGDPMDRIGF